MEWLKAAYGVVGAPFPIASLLIASLLGAVCAGGAWWLVGHEYRKGQAAEESGLAEAPALKSDLPPTLPSPAITETAGSSQPDSPSVEPRKPRVTQSMVNSPGGIQVGGDLHISADKRLIQSIVLEVRLKRQTAPAPVGAPETDVGLQSVVAFFTTTDQRLRFVTDFTLVDQQVAPDTRQVTFVYTPETPSEILGREIAFLRDIKVLAVNYAEILSTIGFSNGVESVAADIVVRLNGVEVISQRGGADGSGALIKGQASFNVHDLFEQVPARYDRAVAK